MLQKGNGVSQRSLISWHAWMGWTHMLGLGVNARSYIIISSVLHPHSDSLFRCFISFIRFFHSLSNFSVQEKNNMPICNIFNHPYLMGCFTFPHFMSSCLANYILSSFLFNLQYFLCVLTNLIHFKIPSKLHLQ